MTLKLQIELLTQSIVSPLFVYELWWIGNFALKRKESDTKVTKRRVHCSAANSIQPAWPGTAIPEPSDFKTWDEPKPISVLGSTGSIGTQV